MTRVLVVDDQRIAREYMENITLIIRTKNCIILLSARKY